MIKGSLKKTVLDSSDDEEAVLLITGKRFK